MAPADLPRPLRMALLLLMAGLLVAVLLLALRSTPVSVELAVVDWGPVAVEIRGDGRVQAEELHRVHAPVSGELHRIGLRPGDRVEAGEVVARISGAAVPGLAPREEARARAQLEAAEAEVDRALAGVESAEAALVPAELAWLRAETRFRMGGASEAEVRGAEMGVAVARARVRGARAGVAEAEGQRAGARAELAWAAEGGGQVLEVRAPVGGRVLRVERESAGPVSAGSALLEVAAEGGPGSGQRVEVELSSARAVQLGLAGRGGGEGAGRGAKEGRPARIRVGSPRSGMELAGRVVQVEPVGRPGTSTLGVPEFRVRVVIEPEGAEGGGGGWDEAGLPDGARVEVTILLEERADRLRVPAGSVTRREGREVVFVAGGRRLEARPVEVELRTPDYTALAGGLEPGEEVVTFPPDRAADGRRYRVLAGELSYPR